MGSQARRTLNASSAKTQPPHPGKSRTETNNHSDKVIGIWSSCIDLSLRKELWGLTDPDEIEKKVATHEYLFSEDVANLVVQLLSLPPHHNPRPGGDASEREHLIFVSGPLL